MCSLIPLFKATWSKGVWKQAGTSNCPPGFVCCFFSQQAARLKLALRRAKMRCNLVVIWPFNLPWDERERGRVCQSIGTVPMWSRSLLPRGWSYDQRDSGALDFLEQALRDAPGLLQQLWHPLRLPCRLIKLTADTRSRGGLFFYFLSWLQPLAAGSKAVGTSQQKQHEMRPSGEDQSQRFLRKFPCVICADVTH